MSLSLLNRAAVALMLAVPASLPAQPDLLPGYFQEGFLRQWRGSGCAPPSPVAIGPGFSHVNGTLFCTDALVSLGRHVGDGRWMYLTQNAYTFNPIAEFKNLPVITSMILSGSIQPDAGAEFAGANALRPLPTGSTAVEMFPFAGDLPFFQPSNLVLSRLTFGGEYKLAGSFVDDYGSLGADIALTAVPEPSTYLLFGSGLLITGIGATIRQRTRHARRT